jgi:hypothetical protein
MGLNELEIEIGTWLKRLEDMQRENTDMKTRLAEAVKQTMSSSALEEAEQFQNRFLNKDTVISFLRADIKKHAQKLAHSLNGTEIQKWQNKLRTDMQKMDNEFHNMRSIFTDYLLQFANVN